MNSELKIYCIIPAYNEAKTIEKVVLDAKKYVNEVVVVDDGSSDNTFSLAESVGAVVLKHLVNRGQGAALQTGMDYALKKEADIFVHFDADGQFIAEEINEIIAPIIKGEADVVFGSRFLNKTSRIPWFKKNIIMPLARFVSRFVLNIKMSDPQSGFRALNRKAAQMIKIENDNMAHCSEILVKTLSFGLRIREVPITVIYNEFGLSFWGGFRIIKDLFLAKLIN